MDEVDKWGLEVWAAPERNKQPIWEELEPLLADRRGILLEIASATGQHAAYFAPRLPQFEYFVSDYDEEHLTTLQKRKEVQHIDNWRGPLRLDVTQPLWPLRRADVIYNANMIHIAPWEASVGLFSGASKVLSQDGLLITYGPYKFDGQHTSASNEKFDASLRSRDPAWGVRDVTDLQELARRNGMALLDKKTMPANNFLLVWQRDRGI